MFSKNILNYILAQQAIVGGTMILGMLSYRRKSEINNGGQNIIPFFYFMIYFSKFSGAFNDVYMIIFIRARKRTPLQDDRGYVMFY